MKDPREMTLDELLATAWLSGFHNSTKDFNGGNPFGGNFSAILEDKTLRHWAELGAEVLLSGRGRKEVLSFAVQMERRLRENEHRGDWRTGDLDDLIAKAALAWEKFTRALLEGDFVRAIAQSPDCANWPMIFADWLEHKGLGQVSSVKTTYGEAAEK